MVEHDPLEALQADYERAWRAAASTFSSRVEWTCPLCGSVELSVRVKTPDLLQAKPGQFTLEDCSSCGHIFQNPRLAMEGLKFYYKDFWEGLGWRPRASLATRLWRKLALLAFSPPLVLALIVDAVSAVLLRSAKRSNTYRLLARRLDDTEK